MCGIIGAVGLVAPPDNEGELLASVAHRGPDAEGTRWRDGVWLGFRRLSILDLDPRAGQPMVHQESQVAVVFNGEIYNYLELRRDLECRGHRFLTTGDTEVLLRGYLEWGDEIVERCNGMFAFAVHDPRRPGVLLARDRFGEKPLHIGRDRNGVWWFASEPGSLRLAGVGTGRFDLDRVAAFLVLGDVEDPAESYFEGISQLPPGTIARLTPSGLSGMRRWWSAHEVFDGGEGPPPAHEEIVDTLGRSVGIRLRSDVRVGTSLSGGIDSSAVVASLRDVDPDREYHAFTASFPGSPLDEWDRAAATAERHGLALHRVEPTVKGFLDDLDALVGRQGAPIESPTVYAQWCVMREARDVGVTVLLDGQGADETWGGYHKYVGFALLEEATRGRLRSARRARRLWRDQFSWSAKGLGQACALVAPASLRRWALAARSGFGPRWLAARNRRLPDPYPRGLKGSLLRRAAQADVSRTLLPRLLRYADRNSMAWGREIRLPFLDPEVVALAARLDWRAGIRDGWTKLPLRRVIDGRAPESVVWRRDKVAYQTPDDAWLAYPPMQDAVASATESLRRLEVLTVRDGSALSPWRRLTLARFAECYRLTP